MKTGETRPVNMAKQNISLHKRDLTSAIILATSQGGFKPPSAHQATMLVQSPSITTLDSNWNSAPSYILIRVKQLI